MSECGVIWLNHGQKHCARLVVSLYSLRRHYGGPALILDTGESGGIVEQIAADRRPDVKVKRIPFVARRRNSAYVAKASLWRESPFDVTLFMDADTLVAADVMPLIEICDSEPAGFVVTRFGLWNTQGKIISSRLEAWRGIKTDAHPERFEKAIQADPLIKASLAAPHPAINTGIVCWRSDKDTKKTLRNWERLTQAGWRRTFTDEIAAQLGIRAWPHTLVGDRYNCSPLYGQEKDRAVIWHAHGSKALIRPDGRGHEGDKIWSPVFAEVFAGNVGGICGWAPAGDETLAHNLHRFAD